MKDEKGELVFYKTVIGGSVVGAAGACAGSPFYLVKVHLQSQASKEIAFGHQHHHEGTWNALTKIFSQYGVSIWCFQYFVMAYVYSESITK